MPNGGAELSFYLTPAFIDSENERGRVVRLAVGPDITWDMLPNPTAPRSAITRAALDDLQRRGLSPATEQRRAVLRDLRIAGQRVADLEVRVSVAPTRLGVDGILGLDFFEQFEAVLWYPRTGQVTLRFPA